MHVIEGLSLVLQKSASLETCIQFVQHIFTLTLNVIEVTLTRRHREVTGHRVD